MGEAQRPDIAGVVDQDLLPDPRRLADLIAAPGIEGSEMGSLPGREPRLARLCLGQAAGDAGAGAGLAGEQPQHPGQDSAQDEIRVRLLRTCQGRQGIAIPAEIFAGGLVEPGAAGLPAQGHGQRSEAERHRQSPQVILPVSLLEFPFYALAGTSLERLRCCGGWVGSGANGRNDHRRRRAEKAQHVSRCPRPGPHHRRLGRRSQRHRHIFPGGRAVRLQPRLDPAADLSADGGDPAHQRPDRPGHRPRHRRQYPALLRALAALSAGWPGDRRQYDQPRRRSGRHGCGREAAGRRTFPTVCGGLRPGHGAARGLHALFALCHPCSNG